MVHGFAGSTYWWQTSAFYLSRYGFTVIAIDVPPFGFSDKTEKLIFQPALGHNCFGNFYWR